MNASNYVATESVSSNSAVGSITKSVPVLRVQVQVVVLNGKAPEFLKEESAQNKSIGGHHIEFKKVHKHRTQSVGVPHPQKSDHELSPANLNISIKNSILSPNQSSSSVKIDTPNNLGAPLPLLVGLLCIDSFFTFGDQTGGVVVFFRIKPYRP